MHFVMMIWATVNIWYISFFRFWYISKCYRFLKSVLSFSKPQLNFQKIKMSRILLFINLNFGCSSYLYTILILIYDNIIKINKKNMNHGNVGPWVPTCAHLILQRLPQLWVQQVHMELHHLQVLRVPHRRYPQIICIWVPKEKGTKQISIWIL